MVHAKNYETASTFVKVIQRKLLASFFPGHSVVSFYLHSIFFTELQNCTFSAIDHVLAVQGHPRSIILVPIESTWPMLLLLIH